MSVRCIVPEAKSSVDSHTPKMSVATQAETETAVPGTLMYLVGSDGSRMTSTTPTTSVMAASAAAVHRGIGRYRTFATSALMPPPPRSSRRGA